MENILNADEMRNVENYTMNKLGISSLVLMERAAEASFNHIISNNNFTKDSKVLIMAGNGNNGGDGIALARMLRIAGINVSLCLVGNRDKASIENVNQLNTYKAVGGTIVSLDYFKDFGNFISTLNDKPYDFVIDALLGIGLSRNLEGDYLKAVTLINYINSYVYSLDIPTGINTDNGLVMGEAVNANETLCFSEYKLGLILNNAPEYTGKITLFDVGILKSSNHLFNGIKESNFIHLLNKDDISELMPKRSPIGHKGTFGKILIIAGSDKMAGAALLSCKSAFSSGAGMVKLLSSNINREAILSNLPELMYQSYEDITEDELVNDYNWADVIVIGPGLSTNNRSNELLITTLKKATCPVIVDADGLNILSENLYLLDERKENGLVTILTPHPGEFYRLFKEKKHNDPYFVKYIAENLGIIIVAKNAKTIISDGIDVFINTSGTDGMAVAGSGDVLTGIIASFIHNSKYIETNNSNFDKINPLLLSTAFAVYKHGLAGENALINKSNYSMTSSDIISNLDI